MARQRMVTRTVDTTVAEVMCLNVNTAEVTVQEYTVSGNLDNNAILKTVKKLYETDEFKCVSVTSTRTETNLYGMTEVDFMKYAKVLPPRSGNSDTEEE